jgi:hypothetical protein
MAQSEAARELDQEIAAKAAGHPLAMAEQAPMTSRTLNDLQEAKRAAVGYAAANAAQNAVSAALRQPIPRPAYETECADVGLVPWSDEEIRRAGYSLTYADFPNEERAWLEFGLGRQRLLGLKREQVQPAMQPVVMPQCAGCGRSVPTTALMNASRRSGVCPDCYDRLSD